MEIFNATLMRVLLAVGVSILLFMSFVPYIANVVPFFDVFSHFRLQMFFAALFFTLSAIFVNIRVLFVIALLALVSNTAPLAFKFQNTKDIDKGPEIFQVAALNIKWDRDNCNRVRNYISSLKAELIGVIEVTPECRNDLKSLTDIYPYMWFAEPSTQVIDVKLHGMGILSRIPWQKVGQLQSPLISRRYAVVAEFETSAGSIAVLVLHLVRPVPPYPGDWRLSQGAEVRDLNDYIRNFPGEVIVMGDLNATPYGLTFRQLRAVGLRAASGSGEATWPIALGPLGLPIDHILVTDGLGASMSLGSDIGSDHRPVLGKIIRKARAGP